MTSSNGNVFRVTGHLCGEFTAPPPPPRELPAQRPVTRSFAVFFDLLPNKRLSKQWWGWWFETLSRPLWRHGNDDALGVINANRLWILDRAPQTDNMSSVFRYVLALWGKLRCVSAISCPWQQGSRSQHGAHLGPTGPRWAPCWPREPCYLR